MRECLQVALWLRGFAAWSRLSGFAALWRDSFAGPCSPYAGWSLILRTKDRWTYFLWFPNVFLPSTNGVNWWFLAWWFGLLGSPHEWDCYLGGYSDSNPKTPIQSTKLPLYKLMPFLFWEAWTKCGHIFAQKANFDPQLNGYVLWYLVMLRHAPGTHTATLSSEHPWTTHKGGQDHGGWLDHSICAWAGFEKETVWQNF